MRNSFVAAFDGSSTSVRLDKSTGALVGLKSSNQSGPSAEFAIHSLKRSTVFVPSVATAPFVAPGVGAASSRHAPDTSPMERFSTWKPYSMEFTSCPSALKRYTPPLSPLSEWPVL